MNNGYIQNNAVAGPNSAGKNLASKLMKVMRNNPPQIGPNQANY